MNQKQCALFTIIISSYVLIASGRVYPSPPAEHPTCRDYDFRCNDGSCVSIFTRCDGKQACADWSDEKNCTCFKDNFQCDDPMKVCIDGEKFCDRIPDCPDGSDEPTDCDQICPDDSFACDGRCFANKHRCDGHANCQDRSDEKGCKCEYNQFRCGDGECKPSRMWCNGEVDCVDGADEKPDCGTTCPEGFGYCHDDKRCYNPVELCIGFVACQHFSLKYECDKLNLPKITCGQPAYPPLEADKLIFGGIEARAHSLPWQVKLEYYQPHFWGFECGGAVIDRYWVVTAAHCVERNRDHRRYRMVLGDHDRTKYEHTEKIFYVSEIIVNSEYDAHTVHNDIALLHLKKPITFNDKIRPICLTHENMAPGSHCLASGWGESLGLGQSNMQILSQAVMPILPQDVCRDWYSSIEVKGVQIVDSQVCAGYKDPPQGTCRGDSGGPLACKKGNRFMLQGIVSWSRKGCRNHESPTIFSRIPSFLDWIEQYTGHIPSIID